jgi:hypothetical protein
MNRMSRAWLKKGEWSLDRKGMLRMPELQFSLSADWGSIVLIIQPPAEGAHVFEYLPPGGAPNWEQVEEWLEVVQKQLEDSKVRVPSLVDGVLSELQERHRGGH